MIAHCILLALLQTPVPTVETPGSEQPVVETPAPEVPEASEAPEVQEPEAEVVEQETQEQTTEEPVSDVPPIKEAGSEEPAATEPEATTAVPGDVDSGTGTRPAGEVPVGEGVAEPEGSTMPQAPVQDPGSPWQPYNSVDLIINEEPITSTDMKREFLRSNKPVSTPEERAQLFQETAQYLISERLKVQAGKDMKFDPELVERYVRDHLERTREAAGSAGKLADRLKNLNQNANSYHDTIESQVLRDLWTGAVVGQYPGVGGRVFRDRYVRPSRLKFEFDRREGGLDLPSKVILQEQVYDPSRTGSLQSAQELAMRVREQILAGGDFGELGVANNASASDTEGVHAPMSEANLASVPGVAEFLATAVPGDISEVLAVRSEGVLRAWRIIKLLERDEGEVARFDDADLQALLRESYLDRLDGGRENEALALLLEAAYVWPPDFFGRPAAAPTSGPVEP